MEKEGLSLEKGINWLLDQVEAADKKKFKMNTPAGKQKYALAQERLKDNWVNYERNGGKNPWILAILRKQTGLPSSGGMGGLTIDSGKDAIPQGLTPLSWVGKNWAWGRNKLTVNKAGTHYKSGHARGTPTPSEALKVLQGDQKWVYKALTNPTFDREALKNIPWVILNSPESDIKELIGRWGPEDKGGRTGMLTTGGNILDRRGGLNPFASDQYIDANAEIQKGTTITRRRFLGTSSVNNPIFNRVNSLGAFKTNTFKDLGTSGYQNDGNNGTGSSVGKTIEYNNRNRLGLYQGGSQNVEFGSQQFVGRGTNVLKDGDITSLSINQLNRDWNGVAPGENLGVMTRGQRKQYKSKLRELGINYPSE